MRPVITLLLLMAFGSSFAQKQEIKAPSFKGISIFGPFKVTLVKATASRAEIDYRGIDPDDVTFDCSNDEFEIKLRTRSLFDFSNNSNRYGNRSYAIVTIYYTSLDAIEVKGGASLHAAETITS